MKESLWKIIKMVYSVILRPLVLKAIDDPDSQVDDFVIRLLDNLFEFDNS